LLLDQLDQALAQQGVIVDDQHLAFSIRHLLR